MSLPSSQSKNKPSKKQLSIPDSYWFLDGSLPCFLFDPGEKGNIFF
jgi:hypothetical protein